ncbi:Cytochrome c [Rubripirellula amarantea]|uniref:Cytochrome c n=1 Tax=Rubripirellula amarantea TaxID=2527999 RepID=A0A5C5WWP4_9BACT|nr:PVC-type heme-binding CxxCH protein [Rubripirellula amarantea]TWT54365.1 Cytochrome c [Rubripirellula amarantea]
MRFSLAFSLSWLLASVCFADFPELFNTEPESEKSLMPADEAAAKMSVPEGFRVTAFAGEPDVQNPIDAAWDSRGRLWVAENYTYAERDQRFQLDLRDRIVIFGGTDQDQFTERTVFTDDVQMLTSVEVGRGGVWLMCPPQLIFIPDADHDDVPDNEGEVVLDGFKVADQNYHNFANGLRFGPDGWLYGRCGGSCPGRIGRPGTADEDRLAIEGGMWRYHPDTQAVEVLTTGTTNPWGHDWNDVGEAFFVNTVNGHLWHMIPGAHFTRPFTLDPNGKTYELIDFHADHWHFDTGQAWNMSRDGVANSYGGGHAHSGTMIYQGGTWPSQYRGRLFTLNFHGRRANQEILERDGSGYVAHHGKDTFLAADPWFRGMEITSGPDGNAFILDWSDAGECHEHTGVHRTSGRIFKVSHGSKIAAKPDLKTWSSLDLAKTVTDENVWYRRQAKIELASRRADGQDMSGVAAFLTDTLLTAPDAATEVQAQLMLHIIGKLNWGMNYKSEYARATEIRLAAEVFPIDDAFGPDWKQNRPSNQTQDELETLLTLITSAVEAADSPFVDLTIASCLQRLPVEKRASIAKLLSSHNVANDDHNLPLMIWYGLIPVAQTSPEQLVDVAKTCQYTTTLRLIARALAEKIDSDPEPISALLEYAAKKNDESYQHAVLAGVAQGLKGRRQAPRPQSWDSVVTITTPSLQPVVRELSVVFGDGRAMDELTDIVTGKVDADFEMRHAALETLIQSDAKNLRGICMNLLGDARMNVMAARGLSKFDDPEIGKTIVDRYQRFRAPQRPKVMSILVSRKSFALPMLDAIAKGKIQRKDLSAYQVRQLHGFNDPELSERVREVWGEVRDAPEAMAKQIEKLKSVLTDDYLAEADKSHGRSVFAKSCQNCHKLYGEGQKIGPDLTGANRGNLDYLLDNIVSPSSVVDKDFRMTLLLLDDGRVVSGLVTSENDNAVTIQTATELITLDKELVVQRKVTDKSPMPDGLLDQLTETDIRDLIGYLKHPSQVSMP